MTLDELRALATIERDGYHVFEAPYAQMSVTLEDGEWLYGLVRMVKPAIVVELGTGLGVSARFIAEALKENGRGQLLTVEPDKNLAARALGLLEDLPCNVLTKDLDWKQAAEIGLVFIDSGFARRADDIKAWMTCGYAGLVVVHDSKRGYDLHGAQGVFLPGLDGMWLGRAA